MKLLSIIQRLTYLEKLKRTFLVEKKPEALLKLLKLQEKILHKLKNHLHPASAKTPTTSSEKLNLESLHSSSAPQEPQLHKAIHHLKQEQTINTTLLTDIKKLTETFFYIDEVSYNQHGQKNRSAVKRYSHST